MLGFHTQLKLWQAVTGWVLVALSLPLLFLIHYIDTPAVIPDSLFLPFHTVAEIFAVIIAALIFVTCYRAIGARRNGAVILLGILFLGVSLIDLMHVISYTGMPDSITKNTANKTIYFWLAARLIAVTALLIYVSLPESIKITGKQKKLALFMMLLAVTGIAWPAFTDSRILPQFFIEGHGLTTLKIGLEWLIVALCMVALAVVIARWKALYDESHSALLLSISFTIISELFFTTYLNLTDIANVLGHVFKVFSYMYLFQATVIQAFNRPVIKLAEDEQREKAIIDSAHIGILLVDQDGIILRTNPAMEKLTGYSRQDMIGSNVSMFLPQHLRSRHGEHLQTFFNAPTYRPMNTVADLALRKKDGTSVPVDISLGYWHEAGQSRAVAFVTDIAEKIEFEERLRYQATHDELTGLANRWLFMDRLKVALEHAKRDQHMIAVLLLDLDNFKVVNDSYGHAAGDEFLQQVANRFVDTLRSEDQLARFGGDEFAVFLPDCGNPDDAATVANKLVAALNIPIENIGRDFTTSVSIGVALYPQDGDTGEELVRLADLAMYQAKDAGRGSYAFYSSYLDIQVHENAVILPRLMKALEEDRLELFYQPEISFTDNSIIGAEALLRWYEPDMGFIPPSRFIKLAEASGLILRLDQWTLNRACLQIRRWMDAGMNIRVAVNFSAHQFRHTNLVSLIESAIREYGIDPSLLELEVTETAAMHDPVRAALLLNRIVELGVLVTLDDFGTGYSSLAYLKRLPFNKLKIDGKFVRDITADTSDAAIVESIIALAKSLRLGTVAECVETEEQLVMLKASGCDSYQGFYYSPAVTRKDFEALYKDSLAGINASDMEPVIQKQR